MRGSAVSSLGYTALASLSVSPSHGPASSDLALAPGSNAPAFLPYDYPGVAAPGCGDAFCTGENPPGNVTARSQGSWHRAVHATFQRSA